MDNFSSHFLERIANIIEANRLEHPAVKDYLTTADRRILAGARFVLEALSIPYPDYLTRKPAGRPIGKRVMDDFRRDHPETLHQATMRKAGQTR